MGYKNGKNLLPVDLIKQIQNYVDGETIYIPKKEEHRNAWGQNTGTKQMLRKRDADICRKYLAGHRVVDLSEEYHISPQGIYKILSKQRQQ